MSFTRHQVEEHSPEYGDTRRIAENALRRMVDMNDDEEEKEKIPSGLGSAIAFATVSAIAFATVIQNKYSKRLVCGSLALMLYEAIPKRRIGDLDFVSYEKNVKDNKYVSLKCSNPYKHCLFLSSSVKEGETIHGLKLQNLDQIIYWKKKFGRERDLKDLENYTKSQYFKEEEFLIDL
jgi:hypothetical protein